LHRRTNLARQLLAGDVAVDLTSGTYAGPTLEAQLLWGAACGGDAEIVRLCLDRIDWHKSNHRWFNMAVQPLRIWNHSPQDVARGIDRASYHVCFELIIARCDVNLIGPHGATLLHYVAGGGRSMTAEDRLDFATKLLDAGARLDVRDTLLKSTPLAWAVRWGRTELLELYLSRGARVDEPDAEPWATPLAWARRTGRGDLVAQLEAAISG
jgi:hypothetical protein